MKSKHVNTNGLFDTVQALFSLLLGLQNLKSQIQKLSIFHTFDHVIITNQTSLL